MSAVISCPQCGKAVPADAPQGQCPACMMQIGGDASALADRATIAPQSPLPEQAVTTDEVATLPPQTPVRAEYGSKMTPLVEFVSAPTASMLGATSVHVPGYEILGELGRGGMGVVYKARHLKLNRVVALKMILAGGHAGEAELARFRTEAEAIARLQHPNIVQVHEIGEHDGKPYFSLEFCAGGSLAQKLDGTPLQPKHAARLVETLARAMAAAHQKGIIHRDLKPANVLLSPLPLGEGSGVREFGTPKITDFGLAKLDDAGQTQSGAIMGTPSYMAPEQGGGKTKALGPAADVYALGAILYELLTGRPPFKAATPLDTVLQVVSDDPVPPRQLQSRTPRDLETICLKCLQKEPAKRYASAEALAEDLRRFLAREPIKARPVGGVERVQKWVYRRPVVAGLLAAVCLVTLAGIAAFAWAFDQTLAARDDAINEQNKTAAALKVTDQARIAAQNAEKQTAKQLLRAESLIYVMQIQEAHGHLLNNDVVRCRAVLDDTRRNLRGPDYGYIAKQLENKTRTLWGHTSGVACLALSVDGKRLISGSGDLRSGEIKVWDLENGRETLSLRGHMGGVTSLALSVDGKRLCSGGKDQTIKVWDLESGKEILSLRGHTKDDSEKRSITTDVSSLTLSVDGKRLYSASADKTIKEWDLESGKETRTLYGHTNFVNRLALSVDGKRLYSASADKTIKEWDLESGKETRTLRGHTHYVFSVALSEDGKWLFSGSSDRTIKMWDLSSGKETVSLHGHMGDVTSLVPSVDGKRLFSGSNDKTIKVWDVDTRKETFTLRGHTDYVYSLALSADGKRLCSGSEDQTIKVWNLEMMTKESLTLHGHSGSVRSLALSREGKRLFSGSNDGIIQIWDVETGKRTRALYGHTGMISSLALSVDGKRLYSGSYDKTIKVWDLDSGRETLTLRGHTYEVASLALSEDGKRLYSGSGRYYMSAEIKVWNLETGKETLTLRGQSHYVTSLALSEDGKRLCSASYDRTIKVWDLESGKDTLTLRGHTLPVSSLALSVDGKRLCSGSGDLISPEKGGEVKVWDLETGEETLPLRAQKGRVSGLALSVDGKRLFSATYGIGENTITVWDVECGKETLTLRGHMLPVTCLTLSMDGKRLCSASEDRTIKVWDLGVGLTDRELGR